MKPVALITSLMVSMSLLGCVTSQQAQRTPTGWTNEEVNQAMQAADKKCIDRVADPSIDPIRKHIPVNGEAATIQQLASKKKPSSAEKQAILAWESATAACIQDVLNVNRQAGALPSYIANMEALGQAQKQAKARLWAGQISYGDYLAISSTNLMEFKKRAQEISDGAAAAAAQRAQLAAQQQQATAQTLLLFNQASRVYRPPVQTNCVRIGGQTSCTSY